MKRPPVNKPRQSARRPFGFTLLTRKSVQRLADRIDQQLDAFTDEILRDAAMAIFTAFTAREAQRHVEPARIRPRGKNRR